MPITKQDAQGGAEQVQGIYDYDAPYTLGEQVAEVLWAEENYKDRGKSHLLRLGLRGKLTDGFGLYGGDVADGVGRKCDYYPPMRGKRIGDVLEAFADLAREDGLHLQDTTGHLCVVDVEEEVDDRNGGMRPRIKSLRRHVEAEWVTPASAPTSSTGAAPLDAGFSDVFGD